MVFSENLNKNNIIVQTKAKDRWDLISRMLKVAVKNNNINKEDEEIINNSLIEREKSMSTSIGKGIAIPHCTTTRVDDVIIVLATSEKGIDFDAIDNVPVKIAILLIVPKNKLSQHIKTLANIARLMGNDDLREQLVTIDTVDLILKTIKIYEKPPKK